MQARLGAVDGRSVLVDDDGRAHDLAAVAGDGALADPMAAVGALADLDADALLGSSTPLDGTLGCPVPRPQKVFAIGLNYVDHAAEGGVEVPENPVVFTKFPSCLAGPTDDVVLRSGACDYEGELVVVIGRGGRDIDAADAWGHVAGVTVGQDISDRAMQFAAKPPHFDLGKSYDTFGPLGPYVVPVTDAVRQGLRLTTTVNGEVRQQDSTANMVFDVPALVAYLSAVTTLATGDLIFTGTPAGVGGAQGRFLADGDVIVTTVDGIGTMTNRCRMDGAPAT